ncbi:adhesion G-protein coupled receptor G5 [Sarotherodon galilaeus]
MAEDPTATYYRLKNSSVCLNVRKPPPYKHEINPIYKDRVVYSAGNLSLCINNLADTDTGIYEVSYSQNFITMSEKHQVIVQDVVPRPVIIMSKLGSNQSAGLCSITVNCSIQDYWLWSVCDEDGCSTFHTTPPTCAEKGNKTQEQQHACPPTPNTQKSFSEVNITVFTENTAVVCRGNNHVSTNKASENLTLFILKGRLIPVSVLIILGAFSFFLVKTKYKCYQSSQTSSPREEMISMESHKADTIYNCPEVTATMEEALQTD